MTQKIRGYIRHNVLPYIQSYPFFKRFHQPKIKTAFLELTNKCNLRCKMCIYQKLQLKTGYMSELLFKKCIDELSEIGVDVLSLHFGGESLCHPKFKDFLNYAISKRNSGKICSLNWTDNGMLFNPSIADLVIDLKVDSIFFSIDGVGNVNDNIRLGANYSIIEKNIKYLLKKRGEGKKPTVNLLVVDCGKTEAEKLAIYREWIHLVDGISLIPSILPDNTWENKKAISEIHKTISPPKFCDFPFNTLAISWDGIVTGCCLDYIFKMDLGDVTQNSIKKIWNDSKFQTLRKNVLTKNFSAGSPCYNCEFWQVKFEPKEELILDGTAKIEYGHIYRNIRKVSSSEKNSTT